MRDSFTTDKIGLVAFLMLKGWKVTSVEVKNSRNRAWYTMDIDSDEAMDLEQEFMQSEFAKFFDHFKWLRERAIRGR